MGLKFLEEENKTTVGLIETGRFDNIGSAIISTSVRKAVRNC